MVVTFSHPKGGVGKSTLCFNYMSYLQKQGKDFIGADLDGQHTISSFNKIRKAKSLEPFSIKAFKMSDTEIFLEFLQNNSDKNIIVDTGGFDSNINRIAITAGNVVITPLSDSPTEVVRLVSFDSILANLENSMRKKATANYELKTHILINRINPSVSNFDNILNPIKDCRNFVIMDSIVRDRSFIKYSLADGEGVLESKARTNSDIAGQKEILAMCQEIDNLVN